MENAQNENTQNLDKRIDCYALDFTKDDPHGYVSFQKMLEPMFTLQAECKQPFESSTRTYMFKDLIFVSSKANTHQATLTRSANHESAIGSDYILVFFYRDIPIRIQTNQGETEVAPEQIVFADLSKPLVINTSSINAISLNFSRTLLSKLIPITEHMHGTVFREGPHQQLLVNYMKTLTQVAGEIQVKDAINVTETIMHLIANCLQQTKDPKVFKINTNQNLTLQQLKQAIDAQIEDPALSAETLTRQFHVSRASLYRLFEPLGGVAKHIKNRKLDFAFTELAKNSDKKTNISALAYRLGFSQPSVFTRAFLQKFEINPSEVRERTGKKEKQPLPFDYAMDFNPFKKTD